MLAEVDAATDDGPGSALRAFATANRVVTPYSSLLVLVPRPDPFCCASTAQSASAGFPIGLGFPSLLEGEGRRAAQWEREMSNPLVTPPRELVEKGAAAVSAQDNRWLRCDIKSISLVGNVLLRQLSAEAGAAETILFRDGKLTEASASNVFIVRRGVIQSPPKSSLILAGITYDVVAELAAANSLPLEFKEITEMEVRTADEIWVTSSSREVFAIVSLDGAKIGDGRPGPVFRRMHQLYQVFKQKVMRAGKREAVSV